MKTYLPIPARIRWVCFFGASLLTLALLAGCQGRRSLFGKGESPSKTRQSRTDKPYAEALERFSRSLAVRGTIGEVTSIQGLQNLRVRAHGLVVGLGENGSQTCPGRIRKEVAAEIRKKYGLGDSRIGLGDQTPGKLIDAKDTAVVEVEGEIKPAALRGTKFDLIVRALPGTETTSLQNGRLYTCDLYYFRDLGGGAFRKGKIIAKGDGPIFINPFSQRQETATPTDLRMGKIICGGTALENRLVQLVSSSPSYALAISIQNKINDRFGRGEKIATAESPSYVSLKIPPRYQNHELDFLALVRHLYLSQESGFAERRTAELAKEILDSHAPHDNIGLAWEGIGKTVKPTIRNLYKHGQDYVNYYAARTGLRMEDALAVQTLEAHARNPESPYQMEAIVELGDATNTYRAAKALLRLLHTDLDSRARAAAYEGLVKHNDPSIVSIQLGGQFVLDIVESATGPPLVYAKIEDQCRLAIIGDVRCRTPLFYRHPQGLLTMNAESDSDCITMVRQTPRGRTSPPTTTPIDIPQLIAKMGRKAGANKMGKVIGLGLTYSQVIDIISSLCDNGSMVAEFRLERPQASEIVRPRRAIGRPESEL